LHKKLYIIRQESDKIHFLQLHLQSAAAYRKKEADIMDFYKCGECLSVAMELVPGKQACEKRFVELKPNTTDAAGEKHVPVVEKNGDKITVKVGEIEHPMLEKHYIMWIYLETEQGGFLKKLSPDQKPEAEFQVPADDKPVAAYEYCNLHGLWKAEIK